MNQASKKSVEITYFVHGTTVDNENNIATGCAQGILSKLGVLQSISLRKAIKDKKFGVVFCSDLKRAVDSAKLIFEDRLPIIQDKRLRECDYGDLTEGNSKEVEELESIFVDKPFPNGESYKEVEARVEDFLCFLVENYSGKHVAIVSHKAPQLALDVLLKGKTWRQAFKEDWRKQNPKAWKPGWNYEFSV